MEAAISEAIGTTVATFVDKAITGAIEDAFTVAVNKAAEEKVKATEERLKALEEFSKTFQSKVTLAEEKAQDEIELFKEEINAFNTPSIQPPTKLSKRR
jgi:Holliday junction resolvase